MLSGLKELLRNGNIGNIGTVTKIGPANIELFGFIGTVSKIGTHRLACPLLARNSASDGVAWEHDQCVHIVVVSHRIHLEGRLGSTRRNST